MLTWREAPAGAGGGALAGLGIRRGVAEAVAILPSERCALSAVVQVQSLVRWSSGLVARCVGVCRTKCAVRRCHCRPRRWWHRARTTHLKVCLDVRSAAECACMLCPVL